MGGNLHIITSTGETVKAEKIDLKKQGRSEFKARCHQLFEALNILFEAKFKEPLWDSKVLKSSIVYNGSTSFILSSDYTDEQILKVKPWVGDVDIAVPEQHKTKLYEILKNFEEKTITSGIKFLGSNRADASKLGNQINALFSFPGKEGDYLVQVDFEFLPFEKNGEPTEWAKFSHSSSFEDASNGVKAVHHKYLIRALVGALSVRQDIVVATPKSTRDSIKVAKSSELPRMLKFSVDKGVRQAYRPMLTDDGQPVFYEGLQVYKEIPTKESNYLQNLTEIYRMVFKEPSTDKEIKALWTFDGVCKLLSAKATPQQLSEVAQRYFDLLWSPKFGQKLERDNPQEDLVVKSVGWKRFCEMVKFKEPAIAKKTVEAYYEKY